MFKWNVVIRLCHIFMSILCHSHSTTYWQQEVSHTTHTQISDLHVIYMLWSTHHRQQSDEWHAFILSMGYFSRTAAKGDTGAHNSLEQCIQVQTTNVLTLTASSESKTAFGFDEDAVSKRFPLQTFILAWVDTLVEAPILTAAGHLDNVELTHTSFTLRAKRKQIKTKTHT